MLRLIHIFILPFLSLAVVNGQISPEQMVQRMGRGINLGNTLSAPIEGNWASPVEESYFEDVKNAGFRSVRIPIRFDKHTTPFEDVDYTNNQGGYSGNISDYTVDPLYLDRIEEVINWSLSRELVAIIDVHGDHWYWESYDPNREEYKTGADLLAAEDRFRAIWIAISDRFQNYSENLLFEIMNEPYFAMSAQEVHTVNMDILGIIRQNNPTRNVIITGGGKNSWETPGTIKASLINSDDYLIATFHYYKPNQFTKSSREEFNDFHWGSQFDRQEVNDHFDFVLNWSEANDIPILLGEFGADNEGGYNYSKQEYGQYGGPTVLSRESYHEYLAEAAISRGFCFTAWDAGEKSNKSIYLVSDRSWVETVKNALLGNTVHTDSHKMNEKLRVYPNPAQFKIQVHSKYGVHNFEILDTSGKTIKIIEGDQQNIDISHIETGLYYLVAKFSNGEEGLTRFIKAD